MPRVLVPSCPDHPPGCKCHHSTTGTEQGLDELDFLRSACAAAQAGNVVKLKGLLDRRPDQIHSDGTGMNIDGLLI